MSPLLEYAAFILGSFFVFSYGYGQWKQGKNQEQLDNDNIYKGRIEALELKIKLQGEDIEKLTEQVKQLRNDNEDANRKLMEALAILQGYNPQMTEFIKSVTEYLAVTKPVFIRMDKWLNKESF